MIKLVDYFVVVGYEEDDSNTTNNEDDESNNQQQSQQSQANQRGGGVRHQGRAKIIQRFPVQSNNHRLSNSSFNSSNENDENSNNNRYSSISSGTNRKSSHQDDDQQEFDSNIHCFCQPHKGWRLYKKQEPPTFFVSVLTDIKGERRYCACLTFLEPYQPSTTASQNDYENIDEYTSNQDEYDQDDYELGANRQYIEYLNDDSSHRIITRSRVVSTRRITNGHNMPIGPSKLYAAKSLVLISRLEYIDLFKSCLSLIYAVYVDKRHNSDNKLLEIIISNLLSIQVNAPGTALSTTFSLGADDRHTVQATASLTVPSTGSSVYKLFKEIGIVNVFKLVCAIMADFKILFFSRSYTKLYDACRALEALLFPLKYTGVYVPVLPCFGSFLEFPAAPTPYIIGVHASYRRLIEEMHADCLQECVKVDLDGANVVIPQCVDDLICGTGNSMNTATSTASTSSSSSSSGICMSSSSSSYSSVVSSYNTYHSNNHPSSMGLPHYLYESTLNLLFSILKPDVLHADELTEFTQSSPASSTSEQPQQQFSHLLNDSVLFVSQLNSVNQDMPNSHHQLLNVNKHVNTNGSSPTINHDHHHHNNNNNSHNHHHSMYSSSSSSLSSTASANSGASAPSLLLTTNVNHMSQSEIEAVWIDKLLRAVFVRLFSQLFAGYRYCLLIIRINPKPVICFNKANFLGNHCLVDNEFMNRLLDSMSFQKFIEERGPSYRHCDVFDDLYADIQSQLRDELEQQSDLNYQSNNLGSSSVMQHLKQIAEKLYKYEYPQTSVLTAGNANGTAGSAAPKSNPNIPNKSGKQTNGSTNGSAKGHHQHHGLLTTPNRSYSKIKLPTPDAFKRIHSETFPLIDENEIQRLLTINNQLREQQSQQMQQKQEPVIATTPGLGSSTEPNTPRNHLCRPHLVPYGPPIETVRNMSVINKRLLDIADNYHFRSSKNPNKFGTDPDNLDPNLVSTSCARKLDAIAQCVTNIFDNNFKEAKKNLNSAYRALRDPRARLHLCVCLQKYVKRNQVILNNEQFEYVCKLLNEALSNDSRLDEHGVAYSILPLTSAFYRKLNNGTVDQCIYTRLQQHEVWSNMQFWEMAFFTDVQRSIRPVYLSNEEFAAEQEKDNYPLCTNNSTTSSASSSSQSSSGCTNNNEMDTLDVLNGVRCIDINKKCKLGESDIVEDIVETINMNGSVRPAANSGTVRPDNLNLPNINGSNAGNGTAGSKMTVLTELNLNLYSRPAEKTALEICGEQMEKFNQLTEEQRENYVRNEQGIIRSHVLHYITQMVNMKIPLDINSRMNSPTNAPTNPTYVPAPISQAISVEPTSAINSSSKDNNRRQPSSNQSSPATTPRSQSFEYDLNNSANNPELALQSRKSSSKKSSNKRHSSLNPHINNTSINENNDSELTDYNSNIAGSGGQVGQNINGDEDASLAGASDDSGYEAVANQGAAQTDEAPVINGENHIRFKIENESAPYPYGFGEIGYSVWKFVSKFVDRVCMEGSLNDSQRTSLHNNLAEVISMQIQMLETVHQESKRVPLRTKPKFDALKPDYMLQNEHFIDPTPLRCHLVPDGREEICGVSSGGTVLLPAEGALFLTNYRLIFRGVPINDSLMSDSIITRSFPVSALIKEKKIGNQYRIQTTTSHTALSAQQASSINTNTELSTLHDGLQIRSATFQLIKVFFDEEVTSDKIEKFRHALLKIRYPQSVLDFFCFGSTNLFKVINTSNSVGFQSYGLNTNGLNLNSNTITNSGIMNAACTAEAPTISIKTKEKHSDAIRHFAKNTLRKAGLMPRNNNRKLPTQQQQQQLGVQQTPQGSIMAARTPETSRKAIRTNTSIPNPAFGLDGSPRPNCMIDSDPESLSIIDENFDNINTSLNTNSCGLPGVNAGTIINLDPSLKLLESSLVYKDYLRQGFKVINTLNPNMNYDFDTNSDDYTQALRLCTININYQVCKSYPALFLVPRETTDECIKKNSKCHRQNRLPIIVWRHQTNKCVLLRSSGFHGKGFIGMLMKSQASGASNETNQSMEQDKYINEIIKLTKSCNNNNNCIDINANNNASSNAALANNLNNNNNYFNITCMNNNMNNHEFNNNNGNYLHINNNNHSAIIANSYSVTPITNRRSLFASKIEKAVQTIKHINTSSTTSTTVTNSIANNNYNNNCNASSCLNAQLGAPSNTNHFNNAGFINNNQNYYNYNSNNYNNINQNHININFNTYSHNYNPSKFNTIASLSSSNTSSQQSQTQNHYQHHQQLSGINSQSKLNPKHLYDLDGNSASQVDVLNESFSSSIHSASNQVRKGAPLYIICEKSQVKSLRASDGSKESSRYVFIPVDIHEVKDTKNSFKKLCRACVPSNASNELINEMQQFHSKQQNFINNKDSTTNSSNNYSLTTKLGNAAKKTNKNLSKKSLTSNKSNSNSITSQFNTSINYHHLSANPNGIANNNPSSTLSSSSSATGFYKQIHESKWLDQIQQIINISNIVVDRMEEASSVMVSLEDGWDLTAQVVSLAELLLDPYYRTIEGFSVLVEREWLSMGHRFTRRNNHTIDDQTGFAPVFLQFLDCVHQCINQFANAFEFNEFYLEFLAYHYVSNRFKTFLLDSEFERVQFGLINNSSNINTTYKPHLGNNLHTNVSYSMASSIPSNTTCIWQYILKVHYNSAKFFNFNYQPNVWLHSLRLSSDFYRLKVWRYYTKETLCTGPVYDLDLITIGNLNNNSTSNSGHPMATSKTLTSNTSANSNNSTNDEFWYPVPIQNASDYYEQLDQILPTQYEILLKQIMRKYKLNSDGGLLIAKDKNIATSSNSSSSQSPSSSLTSSASISSISQATTDLLNKILSNKEDAPINALNVNIPVNWKNVWDYFYHTVENKLIKDMLLNANKPDAATSPANGGLLTVSNQPDLSKIPTQIPASMTSSTSSQTPPFPKLKHQNLPSKSMHHEFELFIFSSVNVCNLCNTTFKSTTQFTGLKCRNCHLSCHEQCLNDFNVPIECVSYNGCLNMDLWNPNHNTTHLITPDHYESQQGNSQHHHHHHNAIAQLDTSSYSMNTTSSCSTTPNSHYSHINHNNIPASNLNYPYNIINKYQFISNAGKLDTDIGSACAVGLNTNNTVDYNYGNECSYGVCDSNAPCNHQNSCKAFNSQMDAPVEPPMPTNRNFINWSGVPNNEHQTYAGYLKKQGALFKQWKERYFVLDSVKHQLRYYDSANDTVVKGIIDLSDVESINQGLSYMQQTNGSSATSSSGNTQSNNQYSTTKKAINSINFISGFNGNSETSNASNGTNDSKIVSN